MKRFEDPRLVKGEGYFVDDIVLLDMLHASVIRSPHAHALINSVDASAACSLPGMVAVLTGEDIAGILRDIPTEDIPLDQEGHHMKASEQPVLSRDKVCAMWGSR